MGTDRHAIARMWQGRGEALSEWRGPVGTPPDRNPDNMPTATPSTPQANHHCHSTATASATADTATTTLPFQTHTLPSPSAAVATATTANRKPPRLLFHCLLTTDIVPPPLPLFFHNSFLADRFAFALPHAACTAAQATKTLIPLSHPRAHIDL